MLELQSPRNPEVKLTPPENLRYTTTGAHEIGFFLEKGEIEKWYEKVKAAGYMITTKSIWSPSTVVDGVGGSKSFLFVNPEGNLLILRVG